MNVESVAATSSGGASFARSGVRRIGLREPHNDRSRRITAAMVPKQIGSNTFKRGRRKGDGNENTASGNS